MSLSNPLKLDINFRPLRLFLKGIASMKPGYIKRTSVRAILLVHLTQAFTPALYALEADVFQYRLKIQTPNKESDLFSVEVSRRKKDKSDLAQVVQHDTVHPRPGSSPWFHAH